MSAKARGYDDSLLDDFNAEFAMPDKLLELSTDSNTVLCYQKLVHFYLTQIGLVDNLIYCYFFSDQEFLLDTKANLMTYNTFTFKTEAQMLLHTKIWEDNGTVLFEKLKKIGCTRFCYNQIWNRKGTFKTSVLFEYDSPNSFKQCQTELANFAKHIMKELQASDPVIEASRNIVLQDLKA